MIGLEFPQKTMKNGLCFLAKVKVMAEDCDLNEDEKNWFLDHRHEMNERLIRAFVEVEKNDP